MFKMILTIKETNSPMRKKGFHFKLELRTHTHTQAFGVIKLAQVHFSLNIFIEISDTEKVTLR